MHTIRTTTLAALYSTLLLSPFLTTSVHAQSVTEIGPSIQRYSLTQSTGKRFATNGTLQGITIQNTSASPSLQHDATKTLSLSLHNNSNLSSSYTTTDTNTPTTLANSKVTLARLGYQVELNDIFSDISIGAGTSLDYTSHKLTNEGSSQSYYPISNKALLGRLLMKSAPKPGYPGTISWELAIEYPLWSKSTIGLYSGTQQRDLSKSISVSYQFTTRLSLKTSYQSSINLKGPDQTYSLSGRTYTEQVAASRQSSRTISLLYAF